MKEEQISTGYTVILQGVLSFFTLLILVTIGFLLSNTPLDTGAWVIIFCIIVFISILLWRLFSFADVYISLDHIICKKITGEKRSSLSAIRSLNDSFFPFIYYIEFKNDKKVYFQLKPSDMVKSLFSLDPDSLLECLRKKTKLLS